MCDTINAKLHAQKAAQWSEWVTYLASLVPPPPPPPPPPHPDPGEGVGDYMDRVVSWEQEGLLPSLKEACSG